MSLQSNLALFAARVFCAVGGLRIPSRWSALVAKETQSIQLAIEDSGHVFRFCVDSPLLLWRVRTFHSKEPETLKWIREFSPGEVLFDVGANIGLYSIYAASRGVEVHAFEPESANFSVLNRNLRLNRTTGRVLGYCVAIAAAARIATLRLASLEPGAALHVFDKSVDFKGDVFAPAAHQGCVAFSLDDLVYVHGLPCPSRIKIDVDGLESEVIGGAVRLLRDSRLKGILVEVDEASDGHRWLLERLSDAGFKRISEGAAQAVGSARMRNVIFFRGS